MRIWYLVVSCLCFFLFVTYSYAQDYQVGNHVQLVERDFGIPAHPGPGKRKVSHRFPSGSTVTIKAIDSATKWLEVENAQGKGWIVKKYIALIVPSQSGSTSTIDPNLFKPSTATSFSGSKRKLMVIYLDHGQDETFYCGCGFNEDKEIDRSICDYEPKKASSKRARKLEWEHVVPAATLGSGFQCWKEKLCKTKKGKRYKGRKCCSKISGPFKQRESDMHNLFPSIGEVNAHRSNHPYGEVIGEPRDYGQCDVEIRGQVAEPDETIRGDIARAYFYMSFQYKVPIPAESEDMFREWHFLDPPSQWEQERNTLIEQEQENRNPFIDQPELVERVVDF